MRPRSPASAAHGRPRLLILLLTMSAILVPVTALSAPPARAASLTYTYEVRGLGNSSSLEDFAARAAETYGNPIGWSLGGSIGLSRVPSGGDFTLWLVAPQYVPSFSSGCSVDWSCRVGRNVIINEARFLGASTAWNQNGGSLRDYQHMVINHETGHWLGFGHPICPGAGQLAPVMQQQSKDLRGCRPNPWPTDAERTQLARWKGVPILPPPPPPPTGPPLDQARAFVDQGYRDVLRRPADPGGLESWAAAVHDGWLSRLDFMGALISSAEGANATTAAMYAEILGRSPEAAGLASWSAAISQRVVKVKDARAQFWTSAERQSLSGAAQRWIADLYTVELGRTVDPSGLASWTQVLLSQGPGAVAQGVVGSQEWAERQVSALYLTMLHRPPDAGGLGGWSAALVSADVPVVQASLGASAEYFARAIGQ